MVANVAHLVDLAALDPSHRPLDRTPLSHPRSPDRSLPLHLGRLSAAPFPLHLLLVLRRRPRLITVERPPLPPLLASPSRPTHLGSALLPTTLARPTLPHLLPNEPPSTTPSHRLLQYRNEHPSTTLDLLHPCPSLRLARTLHKRCYRRCRLVALRG
jgi:hypothetical protein